MRKYIDKVMISLITVLLFFIGLNQQIFAQDSNLTDMVEVRTTDSSNNAEAEEMIERLNNIDSRILYETNRSGVSIILMDVPLTDLPEFQHLSGTVPRGWEDSGSTWDDVPGAGGFTTAARIGYSDPGNGHSTINLELHEYAHAVDSYTAGFTFSASSEFNEIMMNEKDALFGDHQVSQYFDVPSEYFAEVFAMYYLGGEAQNELQSRAPRTYQYIDTLHNRIVTFGEITGNTMTIHWDEYENAASYNVYQNGEQVDNVTEGEYQATDLDTNTNYEFYVEPLDSGGNALFTSFFRYATTSSEPDENGEEDVPEVDDSQLEEAINQAEEIPEGERSDELIEAIDQANAVLSESSEGNIEEQSQIDEATENVLTAIEQNNLTEAERPEEDVTESTEESEEQIEETTEETEEATEDTVPEEETTEEEATSEEDSESEEASEVETDQESEQLGNSIFDGNHFIFIVAVTFIILAAASAVLIKVLRK